jgi:hypothetical protein
MSDDKKRRGPGLKINNQNSSIPEPPKQSEKEVFDEKATVAAKNMEAYKVRTFELSTQLKHILQDRTLTDNKSPISKDIETETLNKLVVLALEIDADESQPEGFGSTALGMLSMKMLLLQRDTINSMAYAIEQLEKRISASLSK